MKALVLGIALGLVLAAWAVSGGAATGVRRRTAD
jgi:hypothetical protein